MRKKEIYSAPKAKEYLIQTSGALLIEGSKKDYGEAETDDWN